MKDETVKRDCYWVVELSCGDRVLYHDKFSNFDLAWDKYQSFKDKDIKEKASVMLQRRFVNRKSA